MSSYGMVDGFMRGFFSGGKSSTSYIHTLTNEPVREVDLLQEYAYELFLRLLDPESRKRLFELDNRIYEIAVRIHQNTGWVMEGEDFVFRSESHPYVFRSENGYVPSSEDEVRVLEDFFVTSNQTDLNTLHQSFVIKEAIMNGGYMVSDDTNSMLAKELCRFLGYAKEKELEKIK